MIFWREIDNETDFYHIPFRFDYGKTLEAFELWAHYRISGLDPKQAQKARFEYLNPDGIAIREASEKMTSPEPDGVSEQSFRFRFPLPSPEKIEIRVSIDGIPIGSGWLEHRRSTAPYSEGPNANDN